MKTVIVTGATSGIGRASAVALADAGWWVLAAGLDEERGWEVSHELNSGDRAGGEFIACDLRSEDVPGRLVRAAVERTGRLDGLVNNAGVQVRAPVAETTAEHFDSLIGLNLRAAFLLSAAAVPAMTKTGGGVIVNVSSESGVVATAGQAAYNISKASLVMLTKCLAADHSADGIRALTVCPGTTRTPMVDALVERDPERGTLLAHRRPLKRLADIGEITGVITFALSDAASFMTGTELIADGGFTAV